MKEAVPINYPKFSSGTKGHNIGYQENFFQALVPSNFLNSIARIIKHKQWTSPFLNIWLISFYYFVHHFLNIMLFKYFYHHSIYQFNERRFIPLARLSDFKEKVKQKQKMLCLLSQFKVSNNIYIYRYRT